MICDCSLEPKSEWLSLESGLIIIHFYSHHLRLVYKHIFTDKNIDPNIKKVNRKYIKIQSARSTPSQEQHERRNHTVSLWGPPNVAFLSSEMRVPLCVCVCVDLFNGHFKYKLRSCLYSYLLSCSCGPQINIMSLNKQLKTITALLTFKPCCGWCFHLQLIVHLTIDCLKVLALRMINTLITFVLDVTASKLALMWVFRCVAFQFQFFQETVTLSNDKFFLHFSNELNDVDVRDHE